MVDIVLTPAAAERIALVTGRQGKPSRLRVIVDGGGCSGLQYKFSFANEKDADDLEIVSHGVTLVVDPVSAPYLEGATVDYVETMTGAHFKVENPMARASCSCGTSFSLSLANQA